VYVFFFFGMYKFKQSHLFCGYGWLIEQVVDKLHSGGKSKREGWRTELPRAGLGVGVIEKLENEKRNDAVWQGKCSGTVYVNNHWDGFLCSCSFS
jgi:hypothetical protein